MITFHRLDAAHRQKWCRFRAASGEPNVHHQLWRTQILGSKVPHFHGKTRGCLGDSWSALMKYSRAIVILS
jgi:hypothetical protein